MRGTGLRFVALDWEGEGGGGAQVRGAGLSFAALGSLRDLLCALSC